MRALIVEDDRHIAKVLIEALSTQSFSVDHAPDGLEALNLATIHTYEVLIVDIMLPRLDGLSLIERLRKLKVMSPVLILSALQSVDERVRGLQRGGDDYLIKPFAVAELLSRAQALIRRASGILTGTRLVIGSLTIDTIQRKAWRGDQLIELQRREFDLLVFLMQNSGRIVSRKMIIDNVWDFNLDPASNVVEARMSRLRRKIDKPHLPALIQTIRGAGYIVRHNV